MKTNKVVDTGDSIIGNVRGVTLYLNGILNEIDDIDDINEINEILDTIKEGIDNKELVEEDTIIIDSNNGMGTSVEIWKYEEIKEKIK